MHEHALSDIQNGAENVPMEDRKVKRKEENGMENHNQLQHMESTSSFGLSQTPKEEETCGFQIFCCRYQERYICSSLQRLASPIWALIFLSVALFFAEGITNGVFNVTITTVEKRFQLRSTESGLVGGFMDIGAFLSLMIMSYYGHRMFKPLWIGWGTFICALGCLAYALPHFSAPVYTYGEENDNYCGNVTHEECAESTLRNYKFFFMFSATLIGFGHAYVAILGVSYLDENVKQVYSSLYNGIFNCLGTLGPAVGYFLGGVSLELYTDLGKSPTITPNSSLWVGAWWICFIIGSVALLFTTLPSLLLPRVLPNTEEARNEREIGKSNGNKDVRFTRRVLKILRNPVFVTVSLSNGMTLATIFGFITYSLKVAVQLYGLTDATASYYMGMCAVLAAAGGYLLGGVIITKWNLQLRGILILIICSSSLSLAFSPGFLLRCPEEKFVGATVLNMNQTFETNSIISSCNIDCGCSSDQFRPVCDSEGVTYFSPCHAGCQVQINETDYASCFCAKDMNSTNLSSSYCQSEVCWLFYPVLVINFISFFFAYLTITPATQAILRCVDFDERTLALSILKFANVLLGRLLGRMLFAEVLDRACLVSSTECGETGACRAYMRSDMSRNITLLLVSEKTFAVFFVVIALILYNKTKPKKYEDEVKI